jgi:uncharacterized protein (DUF302 family)
MWPFLVRDESWTRARGSYRREETDMASLGMKKQTSLTYDQALASLPELLKSEGFGIITEIDMRETLKKKIGVDIRRYRILGACNPSFAHEALSSDIDIGIMLPCNVAVYEGDDGRAVVSTIDPVKTMASHGTPAIAALAAKVRARLESVLGKLG